MIKIHFFLALINIDNDLSQSKFLESILLNMLLRDYYHSQSEKSQSINEIGMADCKCLRP